MKWMKIYLIVYYHMVTYVYLKHLYNSSSFILFYYEFSGLWWMGDLELDLCIAICLL